MEKITLVEAKDGWDVYWGDRRGTRHPTVAESLGFFLLLYAETLGLEIEKVRLCRQCGEHKPCECPLFDLSYLEPVWHPE